MRQHSKESAARRLIAQGYFGLVCVSIDAQVSCIWFA